MRRLMRTVTGLVLFGGMLALSGTTVLAGGFAEATIIDGADTPPVAGEEREVRVLLLQHGVTPVDFGRVQLSAWLPGSGERLTAPATSAGDGEWIATIAFPSDGEWQLQVLHNDLQTPPATSFAVAPTGVVAWLPGVASVGGLLLAALSLIAVAGLLDRRRLAAAPADARVTEPARAT